MNSSLHVVITGVGIVSALGASLTDFWSQLENGVTGVGQLDRFDTSRFSCRLAAEVKPAAYHIPDGAYAHEAKRAGKFAQYAVAAAENALGDSRIEMSQENPASSGLYLGVSMGGLDQMESAVIRQESKGARKVSPYTITSMLPNMAASLIALRHGFTGSQYTISGACASGSQALGQAFQAIRSGSLDLALVGGTDGVLTPVALSSFEAMRMLSTTSDYRSAPRPFDQDSDGIVIGEGAAFFILEERTRAENRGAHIYGEIKGYATCSGGERIALQSTPDIIRCIQLALTDARLGPSEIGCIYAQAAGIKQGDESELEAFQTLFSEHEAQPAITSIKGHIGHTFAASGPLNVAAALGLFQGRRIPPTLNLQSINTRFATLNLQLQDSIVKVNHCLINTFGFGGINASLIISRYSEALEEQRDLKLA
ncbi:MAG: beta-ketoacyl-[acyl-carrier-protein] synthase family protein [Acidobacteria bacterium]|nr:beta-ketoacyl-[acyl-carrier-protein] synthase family protein [Acidobacteriota bacterium]